MIRPRMAHGWVLASLRPPAVAHRTCATNVADSACLASWMNSSSLKAGSGCLSSTGSPPGPKNPIAAPSTLRGLCTLSESGASSSQNVAFTRAVPAVSPNKRHMTHPPGDGSCPPHPARNLRSNRYFGELCPDRAGLGGAESVVHRQGPLPVAAGLGERTDGLAGAGQAVMGAGLLEALAGLPGHLERGG